MLETVNHGFWIVCCITWPVVSSSTVYKIDCIDFISIRAYVGHRPTSEGRLCLICIFKRFKCNKDSRFLDRGCLKGHRLLININCFISISGIM